ncbi:hypothetical protein TraAM80_10247 [Trypanosoma rangeli]|uniref:Trans-sialidase C-terminal domain-containing protein n=1 Tax=Trypanosoma rangeli TaxID=5698 RepID=A0A3R7LDY4_TRYRA|nr:uncharacterized protein TraAM80_10247 [Trypanosoma rangeli]RNE95372.1 hypothetical protein TraAM80_10247 [Trypanosoma rangeli]|eukprot:RNE95372.1 hypothetical protein TraAM80_10247 [Trypanosoma rangeli]
MTGSQRFAAPLPPPLQRRTAQKVLAVSVLCQRPGRLFFLSNNASDTHWNDECLGVGATVSTWTTTKVENGFRLAGRGHGLCGQWSGRKVMQCAVMWVRS